MLNTKFKIDLVVVDYIHQKTYLPFYLQIVTNKI